MGALIRAERPIEVETFFQDVLGPLGAPHDPRAFFVIATRAEAQEMLAQDRLGTGDDPEWTAFFVESMVEFLVWSRPGAGRLAADDLDWLTSEVALAASPGIAPMLFALVRELNEVPEALMALALKHAGNRRAGLH